MAAAGASTSCRERCCAGRVTSIASRRLAQLVRALVVTASMVSRSQLPCMVGGRSSVLYQEAGIRVSDGSPVTRA